MNEFSGHKHTVLRTRWNPNGMWFASAGRDQVIMINDIRMMRTDEPFQSFKGHNSEVTSLSWHRACRGRCVKPESIAKKLRRERATAAFTLWMWVERRVVHMG